MINGYTLLTGDRFISSSSLRLFTDAAGSKGFGLTHGQHWAYGPFSSKVQQFHINILELYPIALAVKLFGLNWHNKNILFISDNLSIVYCLNKQTSKDPVIMRLIRFIVLEGLRHIFCFRAKHIGTKENSICDKLSRFQVQEALAEAPYLELGPMRVPGSLSPETLLL